MPTEFQALCDSLTMVLLEHINTLRLARKFPPNGTPENQQDQERELIHEVSNRLIDMGTKMKEL